MTIVLVTGGAGYIGSHACKMIADRGWTPVTFDNFSTGWREAVRFGPLVEGDLADTATLARVFATYRPDAVMHFAAFSLVGESQTDPGRYWRNNVGGTLALLEVMAVNGAPPLVFSSTAAVYGEPDRDLIPEDAPTRPTNTYGATKLAIERMIADFGVAHGLRAAVFRYFNVAGAAADAPIGENHRPETHLVPIVLEAASGRRAAVTVFGDDYPTQDGTCIRDYIHVEDLIEAHLLGLDRLLDGGNGLTVNLGTGRGQSVREVIDAVTARTGLTVPWRMGERRVGDPSRLVCDGTRAAAELGWHPTRSTMERMIEDAWRWHQSGGYAA